MLEIADETVLARATDERTLDPESATEWAELRALGHEMLDDMMDHVRGLRERAPWTPMPPETRHRLSTEALPHEAQGMRAAYGEFRRDVLPYGNGNAHPRFFGWVQGNGTPLGMLADMLAAGMNPHMAGFDQAPVLVEEQVIAWLAELMGMPAGASGLLTSGGSMANLLGLLVARHARAGFDVRRDGLAGGPGLRVYCSAETHSWVRKAAEATGIGRESLAVVPVDGQGRMEVGALERRIAEDRAAGLRPICVIGTAGTVNTGASDDMKALAEVCAAEGLWFHVDGAFGALAYWSERLRPALAGMERADSIAFDLHKWAYLPFEVGCVLVRDAAAHTAAFETAATYLSSMERGPAVGRLRFADRGLELTRGFKALKVWMSFKAYGVDAIVRLMEQNVAQAQELAAMIAAEPELELMAPVPLNIVCFGVRGAADEENREVLLRVQERGIAVPSSTVVGGRFAIRAAITNHRSRREDLRALVEGVVGVGREVRAQRGAECS